MEQHIPGKQLGIHLRKSQGAHSRPANDRSIKTLLFTCIITSQPLTAPAMNSMVVNLSGSLPNPPCPGRSTEITLNLFRKHV
ncbi:MAG: hypothetical protein MZV63_10545 [Marinilabiliales bacterium]|nr:hypothetical protein [Marinilabiliales bacterium]